MLDNGSALLDNARISSSAYLPLGDPIVRRIAQRAAEFQGYMDADRVDVQATAYAEGGHFKPHYDTSPDDANGRQRKSTIFVILDAECEKCGTIFPNIKADWSGFSKEWCKHLECDESVLATRAVPGSALFWENLDSAGNVLDTNPGQDFDISNGELLSPILVPRAPGSRGSLDVLNHFVNFFSETLPQWNITLQNSTSTTPTSDGNEIPFANLIATRDPPWADGTGDVSRLVLAAHYDSKSTPLGFIGATDSAASCAMLLHVARSVEQALAAK
ncbi:hypothetical protein PRZ48_007235 [Zasmidium cellare]|uniref:Peptide hydrolase n=1 Tax=Zasmidium cellare TaxID=395010 RepID=A0ABR0EJQ7_ZASCE|nr:hypothetical protein PRZ48_007235 [Zasmidium cellare]